MNLDLSKIKKVYFAGIGGIGISAIAKMMLLEGREVYGSDIGESGITEDLKSAGAHISQGQKIEFVPKDVDLIVYTIAIPKYDPKFFEELKALNVPMYTYPQMLGIVTANKYTIAVSGTHGKTTTTAMIAKILIGTGKNPSVIVGSLLKEYKSNLIVGKGEYFVVEACEYERSFLNVHPKILVITNIEPDHLDYYKDLADIESAFSEMAEQTESYIVCDPAHPSVKNVLVKGYKTQVVDYTKYLDKVPMLAVPGAHNRVDASAALAVADVLGISLDEASKPLAEFSGTWRRLEKKGVTESGVVIYDDYAHHPTEIRASLQGLRELYPSGRITVLFQPHLYSRTKALFAEFVTSFKDADRVLFLPIYFAREAPDPTISSELLAKEVFKLGMDCRALASFGEAEGYVGGLRLKEGDVFVTMGAGEAYKVADAVFHTI